MKKLILTAAIALISINKLSAQKNIYTTDITNFWNAYDSVLTTKNYAKQLEYINKLYIKKGTKGLHAFMEARYYTDSLYVNLINEHPKFWNSIRENTLTIADKTKA